MIALRNCILLHPGHGHYETIADDHLWGLIQMDRRLLDLIIVREIRDFPTPYILLTSSRIDVDYCNLRETLLGKLKELMNEDYGVHFAVQIAALEGEQGGVLSQVPLATSAAG